MNILGVDPGVTTGLAILSMDDAGNWRCERRWESRRIDDEPTGQWLHRLEAEVIADAMNCDAVAMEELLAYRAQSADEKVMAQAAVYIACHRVGRRVTTYAPATIRSCVMGSGRATPAEIARTLRFLLRMGKTNRRGESFTEHQQDAVAVALCHLMRGEGMQVLDRCEVAA